MLYNRNEKSNIRYKGQLSPFQYHLNLFFALRWRNFAIQPLYNIKKGSVTNRVGILQFVAKRL